MRVEKVLNYQPSILERFSQHNITILKLTESCMAETCRKNHSLVPTSDRN